MSQKMVISIFLIFLLGSHYLLHPKYYFKISQKGYQFPCKEDIRNKWYISLYFTDKWKMSYYWES